MKNTLINQETEMLAKLARFHKITGLSLIQESGIINIMWPGCDFMSMHEFRDEVKRLQLTCKYQFIYDATSTKTKFYIFNRKTKKYLKHIKMRGMDIISTGWTHDQKEAAAFATWDGAWQQRTEYLTRRTLLDIVS